MNNLRSRGIDDLHLISVPLAPEVRLFLAEDAILLWARLEADAGRRLPPPFWASAWLGGQALARYVLDNPSVVAGRRVLDLASGSGLVAIAAAMAGAREVDANDVDPYAIAAIEMNAQVNEVAIHPRWADLLDGDGAGAEVVLAGDILYSPGLAERALPFLARAAARGALVLVGDPDRGHLPHDWLETVASYPVPIVGTPEDAQIERTSVLTPRRSPA
ncbi:class I SAM-dependent methyltransferase [Phytohabitans sp. LJ34]|uniref:class I SAM-dependent methyltransferase n=1 Tax=Phytohabitans sp. LJ34 TaxID=3452217 RepID=UPI003F88AEAE